MRVTCRQIAKILVRALPLDDEERTGKVEEYTKTIEAMPEEARNALKASYIFSSKVPPKEREDMFQRGMLFIKNPFTKQFILSRMFKPKNYCNNVENGVIK